MACAAQNAAFENQPRNNLYYKNHLRMWNITLVHLTSTTALCTKTLMVAGYSVLKIQVLLAFLPA